MIRMRIEQATEVAKKLGLRVYDHKFGNLSKANAAGVLPKLVDVGELAIMLCEFDGKILSDGGVRTVAMQQGLVAGGTSSTLNSRHLRQSDGYGHALDIVALTPGKGVDWGNLEAFRAMAVAVQHASAILSVPIRQGCDWDMDGILGEASTKEWDWPHLEDPKDAYMPAAIKLMAERRSALGLSDDDGVEKHLAVIDQELAAIRRLVA